MILREIFSKKLQPKTKMVDPAQLEQQKTDRNLTRFKIF